VIQWVLMQDALGDRYRDPVVVPQGVAEWLCATLQRHKAGTFN
jgi:hypothetical protein